MSTDAKGNGSRWVVVMLLAAVMLGGVLAWVFSQDTQGLAAPPVAEEATALVPKAADRPMAALPEAVTAAAKRGRQGEDRGRENAGASAAKPATPTVTTEQLRDRDFRRGAGLKQFADLAKLELQRCLGKVYAAGGAQVLVTFRRDRASEVGQPDRFFPVSFGPAAGSPGASARKCLEGLRSVPVNIERGELSEEEFFTVPMSLPLPGA